MEENDKCSRLDAITAEWLNLAAQSSDKNILWNLLDLLPSDALEVIAQTAEFVLIDRENQTTDPEQPND